jgi:quinohemoprotein ethanol dehydrogenase
MSYNPATGLIYIPTSTTSSFNYTEQKDFNFAPGRQNMGIVFGPPRGGGAGGAGGAASTPAPAPTPKNLPAIGPAPKEGQRGALVAWDPITQKERWRGDGGASIGGGTVTTAGNLVFQVLPDGRLLAYSADKGDKLLDVATGLRGGMGPPITYTLDGKQYVALMGGTGAVGGRGAPPPPPPGAGAGAGGRGANDSPDIANAQAAQRGAGAGAGGAAAPGAGAGGPGPGGFPPGPPPVPPKLLVFMLDGKAALPTSQQ